MLVVVLCMASNASALGGLGGFGTQVDVPVGVPATGTPADEALQAAAPLVDPCNLVEVSIPFWEGEGTDTRTTELEIPLREAVAIAEVVGYDLIDIGGLLGATTKAIPIWEDVSYLADLVVHVEWTEELVIWHPAPLEFTTSAALGQPFVAAGFGQEVRRCGELPTLLEPPTLDNLAQERDVVIAFDQPAPTWFLDVFDVAVDVLYKAGADFTPVNLNTALSLAPSRVVDAANAEVAAALAELAAQKGVGSLLHRADALVRQVDANQAPVTIPTSVPGLPVEVPQVRGTVGVIVASVHEGRMTAEQALGLVTALPGGLLGGAVAAVLWLIDQVTCKDASEPDCIGLEDVLRMVGRGLGGGAVCAVVEALDLEDAALALPPELRCDQDLLADEEAEQPAEPVAAVLPEDPEIPTGKGLGHLHAQSMGATPATGMTGLLGPLAAVGAAALLLVGFVLLRRRMDGI